jgi:hypothetical protein
MVIEVLEVVCIAFKGSVDDLRGVPLDIGI